MKKFEIGDYIMCIDYSSHWLDSPKTPILKITHATPNIFGSVGTDDGYIWSAVRFVNIGSSKDLNKLEKIIFNVED